MVAFMSQVSRPSINHLARPFMPIFSKSYVPGIRSFTSSMVNRAQQFALEVFQNRGQWRPVEDRILPRHFEPIDPRLFTRRDQGALHYQDRAYDNVEILLTKKNQGWVLYNELIKKNFNF